eukprot:SAG22_NODE_2616_length_2375_cov_1.863357_5_plen_70_part_00
MDFFSGGRKVLEPTFADVCFFADVRVVRFRAFSLGNQFWKTHDVNLVLMWLYRIFPGFCLGHGLLQVRE